MGFIVLFAVGGVIGWLASILARRDDARAIVSNVAAGVAGSLLAGLLTSREPLMSGLSATTLIAGVVGAGVILAAFAYLRLRLVR